MATLVIVVDTNETIQQMKSRVNTPAFQEREATLSQLHNFLTHLQTSKSGTVQVTVTASDPGVTPSGSGSIQFNV